MSNPEAKAWIYSASLAGSIAILYLLDLTAIPNIITMSSTTPSSPFITPFFELGIWGMAVSHIIFFILFFVAGVLIAKGRTSGLIISLASCIIVLILTVCGVIVYPIFLAFLLTTPSILTIILPLITIVYNLLSLRKKLTTR